MIALELVHLVDTDTVKALSSNGSHGSHHRITAARRLLKADVSRLIAATGPTAIDGRAHITVTLEQATARRRDPDGLAGTAKPCIDGLVDGGLLHDDGHKHVASVTLRVVPSVQGIPDGCHRLRLEVREVAA